MLQRISPVHDSCNQKIAHLVFKVAKMSEQETVLTIIQLDPQLPVRTRMAWKSRRRKRRWWNSVGKNLEGCTHKVEESSDVPLTLSVASVNWIDTTEPAPSIIRRFYWRCDLRRGASRC